MKLEPLKCASCGGAVPLAPGHTTNCPYCHNQVPIPQDYVEWRQQHEDKLLAEERLFNLHEKLGKRPSRIEVMLSKVQGGCSCSGCLIALVVMQIGGMILSGLVWLLNLVFSFAHTTIEANPDAGGSVGLSMVIFLPYFIGSVIVLGVLTNARRKVLTLAQLQGKLLASPPVHEGGPATCRGCGGPLEVQPGHLCSPCYYCGSQNLVALDPEWTDQLRADTHQSQESFAEAMAVYQQENFTGQMKLARNLVGFLVLGWMFVRLGNVNLEKRWPPEGFDDFVTRQVVLGVQRGAPELSLNTPISATVHDLGYSHASHLQKGRTLPLMVPLNKGETLKLTFLDQSATPKVQVAALNDVKDLSEELSGKATALNGNPVEFQAENKSWHCFSIEPEGEGDHTLKFILEVESRTEKWKTPQLAPLVVGGVSLNQSPGKLEPKAEGSKWANLAQAEVILDQKLLVRRVRGPSVTGGVNLKPGNQRQRRQWLDAYGPGELRFVVREEAENEQAYLERVYATPAATLRIQEVNNQFQSFDLERGPEFKAPPPKATGDGKLQRPLPEGFDPPIPFANFVFDSKQSLTVLGVRPGATRAEAEKILGSPQKTWGRYAFYGDETVCYWNDKVQWIRARNLAQGRQQVAFEGDDQGIEERFGKPFLKGRLTGHSVKWLRNSLWFDANFYHYGGGTLVVNTYNGEILSAVLLDKSLFASKQPIQLVLDGDELKVGQLKLKKGSNDLDAYFRFLGQEHIAMLLLHSNEKRMIPDEVAGGTERSFQYWVSVGPKRVLIEHWKDFNKIQWF